MADVSKPPVTASVWAQQLWTHLTDHGTREGAMLAEYVAAAAQTESKALQYVIDLLVEDEHRHHRLFAELALSIEAEAELDPRGPAVPRLDFDLADADAVLALTRRLLDGEREDAAALERLHKELHDVEDTTLWGLLVELMQHDTRKHIAMLRFVEEHTARRR